jgi:hypothetical protein
LIDIYFIEAQEPEAIQDLIVRLVKERVPARFGWTFRIGDRVIPTENDYHQGVSGAVKRRGGIQLVGLRWI